MKINKEQPPAPSPEYVLRMSYPDLHALYHELHDLPTEMRRPMSSTQTLMGAGFTQLSRLLSAVQEWA